MKNWKLIVGSIVALIVVGIALGFMLRGCGSTTTAPDISLTLTKDEDIKIVSTPSTIAVAKRKPDGSTVVTTQPNYGHGTTVTRRTDGNVVVKAKEAGMSNDFGLSLQYDSVGMANEFAYWRRLSFLGGSQFINIVHGQLQLNLWAGVGYRIPYSKLNNISVYGGYDTDQRVIGGLFFRFGNS